MFALHIEHQLTWCHNKNKEFCKITCQIQVSKKISKCKCTQIGQTLRKQNSINQIISYVEKSIGSVIFWEEIASFSPIRSRTCSLVTFSDKFISLYHYNDFYTSWRGIHNLPERWSNCVEADGQSFEKTKNKIPLKIIVSFTTKTSKNLWVHLIKQLTLNNLMVMPYQYLWCGTFEALENRKIWYFYIFKQL